MKTIAMYLKLMTFAGSLSKQFQDQIPVALYTKDEDYLQLVDHNTVVWMNTSKATDIAKTVI
ncbi:hypothetical protein Q5M85_02425 [Paraclostridium bifermentans]|nr:hypothetical protein [Paraclostridium bifermentans]